MSWEDIFNLSVSVAGWLFGGSCRLELMYISHFEIIRLNLIHLHAYTPLIAHRGNSLLSTGQIFLHSQSYTCYLNRIFLPPKNLALRKYKSLMVFLSCGQVLCMSLQKSIINYFGRSLSPFRSNTKLKHDISVPLKIVEEIVAARDFLWARGLADAGSWELWTRTFTHNSWAL